MSTQHVPASVTITAVDKDGHSFVWGVVPAPPTATPTAQPDQDTETTECKVDKGLVSNRYEITGIKTWEWHGLSSNSMLDDLAWHLHFCAGTINRWENARNGLGVYQTDDAEEKEEKSRSTISKIWGWAKKKVTKHGWSLTITKWVEERGDHGVYAVGFTVPKWTSRHCIQDAIRRTGAEKLKCTKVDHVGHTKPTLLTKKEDE